MCICVYFKQLVFILLSDLGVLYLFLGFACVAVSEDGTLDYGALNSGKGESYQIL